MGGDPSIFLCGEDIDGGVGFLLADSARYGLHGFVFLWIYRDAEGIETRADLGTCECVMFSDTAGEDNSIRPTH